MTRLAYLLLVEAAVDDASIEDLENRIASVCEWFGTLSIEEGSYFENLRKADVLRLSVEGEKVTPWVLMNDTFAYSCGDGEDVLPEEFKIVHETWVRYGLDGLIAWVAKKRGVEPLNELRTENYVRARLELGKHG